MKIYNRLFVGELPDDLILRYTKAIRKNKPEAIYCITTPIGSTGIMEIYQLTELLKKQYRKYRHRVTVLGIALDYQDACELAGDIVLDMYNTCHEINLQNYLGNH